MKNDEQVANILVLWLTFFGILFGAAILGLTLTIIKAILLAFNIQTNI
jgi:hypothetical protein